MLNNKDFFSYIQTEFSQQSLYTLPLVMVHPCAVLGPFFWSYGLVYWRLIFHSRCTTTQGVVHAQGSL